MIMDERKRWLVLNPQSGGHQVCDTQQEADALIDKHPTLRSYAMKGDFVVDAAFLNTIKWLTDPSEQPQA